LPDGTIIVQAQYVERGSHSLVVLDPDCRQTPMPVESITDYALTDTGGLVVLVPGDRFDEIVELSLAGKVVSRRRVTGSIGGVFGRRAGVDYVTMHTAKTELVRIQDGAPQRLLPLAYDASLYPSPSGNALVWIQHDRRPQLSGPLWVSTLQNPTRSATRLDNATTAGWSPSGRMLAVLVDEAPAKPRRWLVGLDANLKELHRIPVNEVDPEAAPVWLDEHRVAVRSADRKRYRWYDLTSNAQGEIGDDHHGSTLWLTRSPDGTLAMWRMGPPGAIDARTEHLWIERPGGALLPLHVDDAVKHFLVPSWSRSGELLVRSLQTGVVSQVALDTGVATQIAQLPETPLSQLYDDHLVALDNGDLLAVNHEIGADVAMVGPEP
jgi:hypothetical protein